MPSPDVNDYVGLELVDLDAQGLIDQALESLADKFPEWVPREGNTELVLLEALAVEAAETVYAINRIPDGLTEALLRLFGAERDAGAPPSASVRFTVSDTAGHTIPVGTAVRVTSSDDEPVDLTTDADLVIAAGTTTGTVTASGAEATTTANGVPAGTALELLDSLAYIDTVELVTAVAGGRDAEDGTAFLDRTIPRLSRLTTTLVRPDDFEAYLAENADVTRVKVLDLYDPNDPASLPGRSPGYIAVAVTGAGGAQLPATTLAALAADLRARTLAGLTVNVIAAVVVPVDVTVRVVRFGTAAAADVVASVTAALTDYLNPDTWEWGAPVRPNELIARADAAAGVDTVLDVTPATVTTLPGEATLVRAGTISVTVQDF